MDHLGRVTQDEYHSALDRRDKRIKELEDTLRGIFSDIYDRGRSSAEDILERVMCEAAEAVGINYPPK